MIPSGDEFSQASRRSPRMSGITTTAARKTASPASSFPDGELGDEVGCSDTAGG